MSMFHDADSSMAEQLSDELKQALLDGNTVDESLLDLAENVLQAHQVYVQLLFVGMVVDRIGQLPHYFAALDSMVEVVDTEDMAEASTGEKLRAISVLNQAIKTKVEIISTMMASKDAVGMLTANMNDTFGVESTLDAGIAGSNDQFLAELQNLPADRRQRVVAVVVQQIREAMKGEASD